MSFFSLSGIEAGFVQQLFTYSYVEKVYECLLYLGHYEALLALKLYDCGHFREVDICDHNLSWEKLAERWGYWRHCLSQL